MYNTSQNFDKKNLWNRVKILQRCCCSPSNSKRIFHKGVATWKQNPLSLSYDSTQKSHPELDQDAEKHRTEISSSESLCMDEQGLLHVYLPPVGMFLSLASKQLCKFCLDFHRHLLALLQCNISNSYQKITRLLVFNYCSLPYVVLECPR